MSYIIQHNEATLADPRILGARPRGRTATQRSQKGSDKVLGTVLGKGSQKGSEKVACYGIHSQNTGF